MKRIIGHLDMDAFFASVEEAATPRFLGKPIVVGAEPNEGRSRGVVSTANYKAREYGIHSAMPIFKAWQLSEDAKKQGKEPVIFLPVDFELYHKVSLHVSEIIHQYSPIIEQASVDEFYIDFSHIKDLKTAEATCQKIKDKIKKAERVTCSIGIGPNRLVAKIAAGFKKPDGLFIVQEKDVQNFLNPLNIRELPGIGPKTAEVFYKKNIKIVEHLTKFSKEELREMMGKHGEHIFYSCRGQDDTPVADYHEAKSIGEQTTFAKNTLEPLFIFDTLKKLSDGVFKSFTNGDFESFKTITITVRFSDFETKTSSKSFKEGIKTKKKFNLEILRLLLPYLDKRSNPKRKPIRLIGVRIEKIN